MAGRTLTEAERKRLLEELSQIPVDADTDDDILRTFLPNPQYERALEQRVLVVRGERGAGKTALFNLLHAAQRKKIPLREIIQGAPSGRRIDGFSEKGLDHPPAEVVEAFAATATMETLRAFWLGHLAGRLRAEGVGDEELPPVFSSAYGTRLTSPADWATVAVGALPALYAWLDRTDAGATETCFVVYDHLDRIASTRGDVRHKLSTALLGLWMSLSQRYERLRGKILLREDLFEGALTSFADATKLEARSVRIDWNAGRLFALLVRRMAPFEKLRDWLRQVAQVELSKHKHLGSVPKSEFDERAQRLFSKALVGDWMGSGPTKGASHKWLINHLQDAHLRVTPRSLLVLLRGAAEGALERSPKAAWRRLLTPSEIQQSLEKASKRRVDELKEDYPVVARLEGLRGVSLFLGRKEVLAALRAAPATDSFHGDPEGAFAELQRLGVLSDRGDDRFDVPDIIRYAFGIKRKGGTRRVT